MEPLKGGVLATDPEKVNLLDLAFVVVSMFVEEILEDGRKGRHTNTGTDKQQHLVIRDFFRGSTIGTIHADQSSSVIAFDLIDVDHHAFDVGREKSSDTMCPGADGADVDAHKLFVWRRGDGEGMPLVERKVWTVEIEILSCLVVKLFLFHPQFHDLGGMELHLIDGRL